MPKILIFESEQMLRDMYVQKYKQAGFEIVAFNSPHPNPVDIVLTEKPDIISMDIIMPDMDGFSATELIKADDRIKNIPLFFLTNMGQRDDQQRGRALGAVEYLVKADYSPKDVVNYVKSFLGLPHQIVEVRPERVKKGRRFLDRMLGKR